MTERDNFQWIRMPCLMNVYVVPRLLHLILTETEISTCLSAEGLTWKIIPCHQEAFFSEMTAKDQISDLPISQASVSKDLEKPGLIASALWTDFNKDGWADLILAGEWMPLTFFKNDSGKLINVTSATGLEKYTGWWNSISACDFDKDGDIDYVAGNLGLNTQYKVSQEEPMRIIAKDFDRNGSLDPICTYYVQGKSYPIYHRNLLLSQIPSLKNKFKTYGEYARATFNDIFPEADLKGCIYKG